MQAKNDQRKFTFDIKNMPWGSLFFCSPVSLPQASTEYRGSELHLFVVVLLLLPWRTAACSLRGSTSLKRTAHAQKAHVPKNHVPGMMQGKSVVFFSPLALSLY